MTIARALALCTLTLAACSAPPLARDEVPEERSTFSRTPDAAWQQLGAGDVVRVTVLGHPELSTPVDGARIDSEGNVALPLVGALRLAGHAPSAARARVEEALARYMRAPRASVELVTPGAKQVWVFGQVLAPGPVALDRSVTALEALALGGGFERGADRENVCILRDIGGFVDVHVFDAATPGPDGLVTVLPGDFVFVRQSGAGAFSDQVLPILQGVAPTLSALINLGLVAEAIN